MNYTITQVEKMSFKDMIYLVRKYKTFRTQEFMEVFLDKSPKFKHVFKLLFYCKKFRTEQMLDFMLTFDLYPIQIINISKILKYTFTNKLEKAFFKAEPNIHNIVMLLQNCADARKPKIIQILLSFNPTSCFLCDLINSQEWAQIPEIIQAFFDSTPSKKEINIIKKLDIPKKNN
ncbi:MAG: hypothetical protein IT238_03005 [Bacteroidia bacterium]|nr:hypothetical protein [Bacteroidia bacterium]